MDAALASTARKAPATVKPKPEEALGVQRSPAEPVAGLPAYLGILQRKCGCGAPVPPGGGRCSACESAPVPGLPTPPGLTVGAVDDPLEQEADAMADRVLSAAPAATATSHDARSAGAPQLQRAAEAPAPATPAAASAAAAPGSVGRTLAATGRPLDSGLRRSMEQGFGADFSGVRVHDDAEAAESADAVGARAYTVGQHLVFNRGHYAPGSDTGRRLLAHELAHVLQQQSRPLERLQRAPDVAQRRKTATSINLLTTNPELEKYVRAKGCEHIGTRPDEWWCPDRSWWFLFQRANEIDLKVAELQEKLRSYQNLKQRLTTLLDDLQRIENSGPHGVETPEYHDKYREFMRQMDQMGKLDSEVKNIPELSGEVTDAQQQRYDEAQSLLLQLKPWWDQFSHNYYLVTDPRKPTEDEPAEPEPEPDPEPAQDEPQQDEDSSQDSEPEPEQDPEDQGEGGGGSE